jgi:hypothetical protein
MIMIVNANVRRYLSISADGDLINAINIAVIIDKNLVPNYQLSFMIYPDAGIFPYKNEFAYIDFGASVKDLNPAVRLERKYG